MSVRNLRRGATVSGYATPSNAPIYVDSDDNIVKVIPAGSGSTEVQIIDASSTQTISGAKTFSGTPVFSSAPTFSGNPVFSGVPQGVTKVEGGVITELNGDGAYSISVTIPAGALVTNFFITGIALWTAGTSATLIVGDTADPDGFVTGVNAKTTPAVGTSITPDTVPAGSVDGAYLGDTNGEFVGPATADFGRFYQTGSIITATITKAGAGTAGRTHFAVAYVVPETVAQVVV